LIPTNPRERKSFLFAIKRERGERREERELE
jgi:hypothetical protein